jgi:hypothetical protein
VVGYDAASPALLVSDADAGDDRGAVRAVPLDPGTDLEYVLGDRRCAGVVDGRSHHVCGAAAAPHCPQHATTWVCARCTGTCLKDEMDCFDDHAVYLAAFAPDAFKVGVTREWRLETRLREQGADRAAHVRTVGNGRVAREIESGIAESLPDRVRIDAKVAGLGRAVDGEAWRDLLADFDPLDTFGFDYGLDLDGRPVAETLAAGSVRGTKGRLLVLDRGGSTYAVDLRDLVGHEIERGRGNRELQSSLGAF